MGADTACYYYISLAVSSKCLQSSTDRVSHTLKVSNCSLLESKENCGLFISETNVLVNWSDIKNILYSYTDHFHYFFSFSPQKKVILFGNIISRTEKDAKEKDWLHPFHKKTEEKQNIYLTGTISPDWFRAIHFNYSDQQINSTSGSVCKLII